MVIIRTSVLNDPGMDQWYLAKHSLSTRFSTPEEVNTGEDRRQITVAYNSKPTVAVDLAIESLSMVKVRMMMQPGS